MSYIGTNKIGKMYLGSTAIGKAYLGNDLVFQQGGAQPVMIPYIRGGADGSYIDTGIVPDNTTRVIVWARNFNPNGGFIFGSRIAFQNQAFALNANTDTQSGRITVNYGDVANNTSSGDHFKYLSGYHKYEMQAISVSVDDTQLYTGSGTFSGNSLNLHLFGLNNGGTHTNTVMPMDICACKIYKGGTLVRDYTAVNSPSAGLYDAVSETLFTNAGSGSFTYGEFDKKAYTPLEYIVCDGNQYFDSGAYGTYSGSIVTKFMPTNDVPQWTGVIGIWGNKSSCAISLGTATSNQDNMRCYWRIGPNNDSAQAFSGSETNKLTNKAVVAIKSNATLILYNNNKKIGATAMSVSSSFVTKETLRVGANRLEDKKFIGNFYYVGFGSDRSFVPAKKDSLVGMYDTYNDVFYPSATETPFIAGPTI